MIDRGEPDELDLAVQRARRRMDTAYRDLLAAIEAEYEAKRGPSRIARYAGYSREHVSKLHAAEQAPVAPRHR
jgi:DNA-binding phage protein